MIDPGLYAKVKNKGKSSKSGKKEKVKQVAKKQVISEEIIAEFAKLLPRVFFLETVAACLNVNRMTWRIWLAKGRAEAERIAEAAANDEDCEVDEGQYLYYKFYLTYKQSLARGKTNLLNIIGEAAKRQWTAAAWLLERRFPEEWSMDRSDIREVKKKIQELETLQMKNKENPPPVESNGKHKLEKKRFELN